MMQGLKIVWDASRPSPSLPPLPFPFCLPLSHPLPSLFPFPSLPSPLEVGTPPPIAARRSGGALKLPQRGSAQAPPAGPGAKRILTHFRPKFAPFWVSNAALFFKLLIHLVTTTSSPTKGMNQSPVVSKYRIQMESNGLQALSSLTEQVVLRL